MVLTDYPDSALIDNISHNVRENVPAALAGRVDVQVASPLAQLPLSLTDILLGIHLGPPRRAAPSRPWRRDSEFYRGREVRPNHPVRPHLQPLAGAASPSLPSSPSTSEADHPPQHDALLDTCDRALSRPSPASAPAPDSGHAKVETPAPCLLVFYTHHRPRFAPRDMEFFAKARARGWACDEVVTERYPVRRALLRTHSMKRRLMRCTVVQPMFPEDPGEEEVRATVHGWMLRR